MKIVTIFDRNQDFIKFQYNSIIKHVKSDYEYIVFNNAQTEDQAILNQKECDDIGIECIRINTNYNSNPSEIAGDSLNEAFKYLKDELVFKIDSDMFFVSDININDIFKKYDLIYAPNYKPNMEIMWSGVFGINMKKINIPINFRPQVIPNTDTFGQSCLLTENQKYNKKLTVIYNIQDIKDGITIASINNDCGIHIKEDQIILNQRPDFYKEEILLNAIPYKLKEIIKELKLYKFPEPFNIDMIEIDDVNFIFHFKSSNWCPWYTESYIKEKKKSLVEHLNNI